MREHLKNNTKTKLPLIAIGSGGNINKVFSMSKKKTASLYRSSF